MQRMSRSRFLPIWAVIGLVLSALSCSAQTLARQARLQSQPTVAMSVKADPRAVPAASPAGIPGSALQTVVVTAERVAQNIQRVPASMNVLTSRSLSHLQITTPQDLMTYIPQLQANGIAGEATPMYSIRGVSMMDYSVGQQGPVEEYLDQVPLETLALSGAVNLFDMQRIDVLLGPQGTLYGHNATAGAINFVTQPPKFRDSGYITLGAGNYRFREAKGAVNEVLIKRKLAARVAFTYAKRRGFLQNIAPGSPNADALGQYGIRATFLYKPTRKLNFTLMYAMSRQNAYGYDIIDGCVTPPIPTYCAPGGVGFAGYYRTTTGTLSGRPLTPYQIDLPYVQKRRQNDESLTLTTNWEVSPDLTLTSISGWQEGDLLYPDNTDGAPINIFKIVYEGSTRQLTQEFRVASAPERRFSYIAGVFWEHQFVYNHTVNRLFTAPVFNTTPYDNYGECAANSFGPGVGYSVGSLINVGCNYVNHFQQFYNSWSTYLQTKFRITRRVTLIVGGRYNHDNKSMKDAIAQLQGSDGVPIANIIPGQVVGGQWMPIEALPGSPGYAALVNRTTSQYLHSTVGTGDVSLDFTPTANSMLYLKYSRGYRPGSFNMQFFFSNTDFSKVPPEKLYSVEGGFKTTWLRHRLQVDGALFHYRYIDQQFVDVRPNGSQPLDDIPLSRIYGGELDIAARPIDRLTLHVSLAGLHTQVVQGTLAGGTINIDGKRLPYAPNFRGVFSVDWEALSWPKWALMLHVSDTYQTLMYEENLNQSFLAQPAFSLLSAQASLDSANGRWQLRLWGTNLGNSLYFTNEVNLESLGYNYRHVGEPRMYGGDVTYRF